MQQVNDIIICAVPLQWNHRLIKQYLSDGDNNVKGEVGNRFSRVLPHEICIEYNLPEYSNFKESVTKITHSQLDGSCSIEHQIARHFAADIKEKNKQMMLEGDSTTGEVEKMRYSFIDFTMYKFMLRNQQINQEKDLSAVNFYMLKDQQFNDRTIGNFVSDIIWMDRGSQIEQFKLLRLIVDS